MYIYIYPPTPAWAQKGASPGTTGGVELEACHGNVLYGKHTAPPMSTPPCLCRAPALAKSIVKAFLWAFNSDVWGLRMSSQSLSLQRTSTAKKHRKSFFMGVQVCRVAALKPFKPLNPLKPLQLTHEPTAQARCLVNLVPPENQRCQEVPAKVFHGGSSLPFGRP